MDRRCFDAKLVPSERNFIKVCELQASILCESFLQAIEQGTRERPAARSTPIVVGEREQGLGGLLQVTAIYMCSLELPPHTPSHARRGTIQIEVISGGAEWMTRRTLPGSRGGLRTPIPSFAQQILHSLEQLQGCLGCADLGETQAREAALIVHPLRRGAEVRNHGILPELACVLSRGIWPFCEKMMAGVLVLEQFGKWVDRL